MVNIQNSIREDTKVVILRMRSVPAIDATALNNLSDMHVALKEQGITLIFAHVNHQPRIAFDKHGFAKNVIFGSSDVKFGKEKNWIMMEM